MNVRGIFIYFFSGVQLINNCNYENNYNNIYNNYNNIYNNNYCNNSYNNYCNNNYNNYYKIYSLKESLYFIRLLI